jgi:hypothetical protein
MKAFTSGSCRLLQKLEDGKGKFQLVHSLNREEPGHDGINFLGKLHNTQQHLAFLKLIKKNMYIPHDIRRLFLHSYFINMPDVDERLSNIRSEFDSCDVYIFEICSLKLYCRDDWTILQEQWLQNETHYIRQQTEDDFEEDLNYIRHIIPINKPIVFQCHFRNPCIENREKIYKYLLNFVSSTPNTYLYDPTELATEHPEYLNPDGIHYEYDTYQSEIFDEFYNKIKDIVTFK